MKCPIALLQLLMLTLAIPMFSTPLLAQSANVPRNLIGFELAGRGLIYSVNYDRLLTDRIGVGGGISVLRLPGVFFDPPQRSTTLIVPTYVSWTPVGRTHSPYLAAGVTLSMKSNEFLLGNTRDNSGAFGTLTAGYQYRSERGIVIRPIVSHLLLDGHDHWWPGITLGFAF